MCIPFSRGGDKGDKELMQHQNSDPEAATPLVRPASARVDEVEVEDAIDQSIDRAQKKPLRQCIR